MRGIATVSLPTVQAVESNSFPFFSIPWAEFSGASVFYALQRSISIKTTNWLKVVRTSKDKTFASL